MKSKRCAARDIICLVAAPLCLFFGPLSGFAQHSSLVILDSGWQYRYGDSSRDADGTPEWVRQDQDTGWLATDKLHSPPGNETDRPFLWVKTTLPEGNWPHPVLYLPHVYLDFEAYVGTQRVFANSDFKAEYTDKFKVMNWYTIALPENFQGKQLTLRIYCSNSYHIGIADQEDEVMVGEEIDVIRKLLRENIDSVILGSFFILFGCASLYIFLRRRNSKRRLAFSFGALSVSAGMFYVMQDKVSMLLFDSAMLRYYFSLISLLSFPIWLYVFIEQVVGQGYIIVRRVWQFQAIVAAIAILADFLQLVPLDISAQYYLQLFAVNIVVTIMIGIQIGLHGTREIKLLIAGFCIFGIFGLNDILLGLGVLSGSRWLSHWGALIFFGFLGYIIEIRYERDQEQLEAYSRDLETISENLRKSKAQLEEHSQTLEQKVLERTQSVRSKNRELRKTLSRLQETQNQLVLKEKMASLGSLVAGVAHEVNNPIGAVASAADVTRRCIEIIKEALSRHQNLDDLRNDTQFQKALRLLDENNKVTNMASDRVSRIVRSLKNFARLDEAELQDADIHEGLDSTLTLIHHEIKNRIVVEKDYGDLPLVKCFPNQLNQVFMNILMNAAQAIEKDGTIWIRTDRENQSAVIEIRDSGKGIAPEKLDKVFDPGFTTKGVGVGTGLGLSISYNIIAKHGGHITVASQPGAGSTFRIMLPIKATKPKPQPVVS